MASVIVEATSSLGSMVALPAPDVDDQCDAAPQITYEICQDGAGEPCSPCQIDGGRALACVCAPAAARFPVGTTAVAAVATDQAGFCASLNFGVSVVDTTPPSFEFGEPLFVCRRAPIPRAVVRDNGSLPENITMTCSVDGEDPAGTCDRSMELSLGRHFVTYYATDEAGNERAGRLDFEVTEFDPDPPALRLVRGPQNYINSDAIFEVEVVDNCDDNPAIVMAGAEGVVERSGNTLTVRFSAEGMYNIDFQATDAAGNIGTLTDLRFGIDRTPPVVRLTGVEDASDFDDPFTFPVMFPGDEIPINAAADDKASDVRSGLVAVTVALTHRDSGRTRMIHRIEYGLDGSLPPEGRSAAKNLLCSDVVPEGEESWCDEAGAVLAKAIEAGDWDLTVSALDAAGNATTASRPLTRMSWRIAIDRSEQLASDRLAGDAPALARLFLQQLPDRRDDALAAVDHPELMGDALLFTYAFLNGLDIAQQAGVDTLRTREWLTKATVAAVSKYVDDVTQDRERDNVDLTRARAFLIEASEHLAASPPSYQAAMLETFNAYFYSKHAAEPNIIGDPVEALLASQDLDDAMRRYLDIEDSSGKAHVQAIIEETTALADADHWGVVINRFNRHPSQVNTAFLELLRGLNETARLMQEAQSGLVWVRQWQWTMAQQVKMLADMGLIAAAIELGDNVDDPSDPVLSYALGKYWTGRDLVGERLVDDVGSLYVNNRCLIYEVYNHAGFSPAATPPDQWECDECVLTGECGRE